MKPTTLVYYNPHPHGLQVSDLAPTHSDDWKQGYLLTDKEYRHMLFEIKSYRTMLKGEPILGMFEERRG